MVIYQLSQSVSQSGSSPHLDVGPVELVLNEASLEKVVIEVLGDLTHHRDA